MSTPSITPQDFAAMETLADIARHHGKSRPDQVALRFEGRETSFADFDRHTDQVAGALCQAGVKRGECIAYYGKNSDHYFELLFGAAKMGAITAPIGWRLSAPEAGYIAANAEAKLLFVGPECQANAARIERPPPLIAMEGDAPNFASWRDGASAQAPAQPAHADDTVVLLYTSGTTGKPKGVMLSSTNIIASRARMRAMNLDWAIWNQGDASLVAMPVAHIGGTGWGIVGLLNGVTGIVTREFDPTAVIGHLSKDGVAKLFMVPAALQFIIRLPGAREADYSKLRHIYYGAAPIPVELLRECIDVFGCQFVQQYGLTETCGTIIYLPPEDHDPAGNARMRAAGIPVPGVEIKILDTAGRELAPGEVGEIATRSACNMKGYWRQPEATAAALSADGWLRTGDAGYVDADGYIFIQDRIKDMIVSGAENVYPAEVENAIHGHPDVADVAVIGVPDDTWGEAVKAIVVAKPGVTPDAVSIIEHARARIAHYKAPKSVDFVAALPRGPSGKVLRRELREPYWAGRERRVN